MTYSTEERERAAQQISEREEIYWTAETILDCDTFSTRAIWQELMSTTLDIQCDFNRLTREHAELREAAQRVVSDFKSDYVLEDGTVVDDPPQTYRFAFDILRAALNKEAGDGE